MTTDGNGLHSHTTTATDADILTLQSSVAALAARVAKLEAFPVPVSVPVPVPVVTDLQKAIDATPLGGTLDITGLTFAGSFHIDHVMTLRGGKIVNPFNAATGTGLTVSAGATIDSVEVAGGWQGIIVDHAVGATIRGCHVHDQAYAGIEAFSMTGGSITANLVERIGYGIDPLTLPGPGNCYGIALTAQSGLFISQCSDVLVDGNTVTDVPPWHGIDTHGGQRITFRHNTIARCARALFITTQDTVRPSAIVVDANTILASTRVTNGAALVPITIVSVNGITFSANSITGWAGQSPSSAQPYYDYGGGSIGIIVAPGNVVTP